METELKPVPFVFDLDLKAAGGETTVELANGDLLIEGWGANYDIDREDEAFEEGAFTRGLKTFLAGNAPLCYHHDYKTVIGKVVDAFPIPGKGMWVKAIVDHQPEGSPWRHIYDGIKKGRINQFSCGGIFKRRSTKSGPKIFDVDLLEWSATPVAIGRGTNFSVVAGKALSAPAEGKAEGDLTDDEQSVQAAADERELGDHPKDPQVPAKVEEAPEREEDTSEEDAQREAAGLEPKDEIKTDELPSGTITAADIAAGSITASAIAPNTITTDHLADELRSRFQELKPDSTEDGPTTTELAEALSRIDGVLETVSSRLGIEKPKTDEQKEGEARPTSGPVILN